MGAVDAVLVDAGGVLVLPDRGAVSAALGPGSWDHVPEVLDRAHYRAVAAVDKARPDTDRAIFPTYIAAYLEALEVSRGRRDLVDALAAIFDVGTPSWTTVISESAMALRTFALSHRVVVVSNSQGWMERHLRDAGVWFDVQGALAAGVNAFHFDPYGLCTETGHEHVAGLADLGLR